MMQNKLPAATAYISGGDAYPGIHGTVQFFYKCDGVLVVADIYGLPDSKTDFFAFHIHENGDCRGAGFPNTGNHYNPCNTEHPNHAGDLPPLLSANGRAYLAVLTNGFRINDIMGRTVVIHSSPDDFTTQPSGNAGTKIACGIIRRV